MKSPKPTAQALLMSAGIVLSGGALSAPAWAAPKQPPVASAESKVTKSKSTKSKSTDHTAMNGGEMNHSGGAAMAMPTGPRPLPPLPANLPKWLDSKKNNEIFYKRGPYNFAIYDIDPLARDMNGVAVGHSLAYEALVTGREKTLETTVFNQIDQVLKNPPKLMPAERFLSPTFGQKYGPLELVFDWTHVSHAQTIDNFVSPWADNAKKDVETRVLWDYYEKQGAPFLVTGLPMNMAWLDSQPYSGAFRRKYPKVNALFWGYHWLQTSIYDGLRGKTQSEQRKMYEQLGARYHKVELYDTTRPFMPMMAETSPLFSAKYPDIANGFDNLHMLHDMVNDILATDWMTEAQKQEQIKRAVFIMSPDAHKDCKPGEDRGVIDGVSHDHRFMEGMPGMGMMRNGTETRGNMSMGNMNMGGMNMGSAPMGTMPMGGTSMGDKPMDGDSMKGGPMKGMEHGGAAMNMSSDAFPQATFQTIAASSDKPSDNTGSDGKGEDGKSEFNPTQLMWMPKMGWMNMSQCHHCSMPLPGGGDDPSLAWKSSTLSAEGWTMRVRCALCARDMSAEVKGGSILSLSTEDPNKRVVVFSDAEGNLTTEYKGAVFLEEKAGHPKCSQWSQAFSSRAAFDAYLKENPKFKDAKPLSFEEWAGVEAAGTPETYEKEEGPVKNPYAFDLKARGIPDEEEAN